jgi:hypothetical protein
VVVLNPGWRVLLVGGLSSLGSRCGPWHFVSSFVPGFTGAADGSLLSHFLSNNSEKTVRWSIL